jgi:hypothetical protein
MQWLQKDRGRGLRRLSNCVPTARRQSTVPVTVRKPIESNTRKSVLATQLSSIHHYSEHFLYYSPSGEHQQVQEASPTTREPDSMTVPGFTIAHRTWSFVSSMHTGCEWKTTASLGNLTKTRSTLELSAANLASGDSSVSQSRDPASYHNDGASRKPMSALSLGTPTLGVV